MFGSSACFRGSWAYRVAIKGQQVVRRGHLANQCSNVRCLVDMCIADGCCTPPPGCRELVPGAPPPFELLPADMQAAIVAAGDAPDAGLPLGSGLLALVARRSACPEPATPDCSDVQIWQLLSCQPMICPPAGGLALPDAAAAAAQQAAQGTEAAQAGPAAPAFGPAGLPSAGDPAAAAGALPPPQVQQEQLPQQAPQLSVEQLMAMLPPNQGLLGQQAGVAAAAAAAEQPQEQQPDQAG